MIADRRLAVPLALLLLLAACDSGTSPVAPEDPNETDLTISAHPPEIPVDGTSEIRALALHKDSGVPVRTGTEIRFTTTLGTIDPLARTDSDGIAVVTLRADGKDGRAEVRARSGAKTATPNPLVVMIEKADPNLVAKFETEPKETRSSLTIKFTDDSDGDPTSWEWDFGDGTGSSEQDPVHEYGALGTYLVELTARNAGGADTVRKFVELK